MSDLLVNIGGGVVVAAIIFLAGSYIWKQPKLRLRYERGAYGSGSGDSPDQIRCRWKGSIELYNESAHDASEVRFHWPVGPHPPVQEMRKSVLGSGDSITLTIELMRDLPRDDVVQSRDRFEELMPAELRAFSCVLSYKSRHGKSFYTRFVKHGESQENTYHKWKPRARGT